MEAVSAVMIFLSDLIRPKIRITLAEGGGWIEYRPPPGEGGGLSMGCALPSGGRRGVECRKRCAEAAQKRKMGASKQAGRQARLRGEAGGAPPCVHPCFAAPSTRTLST
jgi:hypothetical protein